LPAHKFKGIIHDPADGAIVQPRQRLVLPGGGNGALGGIHMGDVRAALSRSQGSQAGIAKQVQHADLAFCRLGLLSNPIPMYGLFREKAHMARFGCLGEKAEFAIAYRPGWLDRLAVFPFTAALGAGWVKPGMRLVPRLGSQRW